MSRPHSEQMQEHFPGEKSTRRYPVVQVDTAPVGAVAHAGGVLLTHTAEATGLSGALSQELALWRKPLAVHDPAKLLTDLALSLVLGGDALCDAAGCRAEGGVGPGRGPFTRAPGVPGRPASGDLDATLVTAHSEKEHAEPTFKKGYGFHPLCAFVDHGPDGTGEPLALRLRPGKAGSNTAADHIGVTRDAFKQLPGINPTRPGKTVLVRADGAGGTKDFTRWLTGRRVQYSVGFTLPFGTPDLLKQIPEQVWTPAYDADGQVREGAYVAELTDLLDLTDWPKGLRVIARKENPHPGAQLRFTDTDGKRVTAFATNTPRGQLADLELRHRRRARCEDRIADRQRHRPDQPAPTRLRRQPHLVRRRHARRRPPRVDANPGPARPPRPPVGTQTATPRLLTIPATLARTGRRIKLHLKDAAPFADLAATGWTRLVTLAPP